MNIRLLRFIVSAAVLVCFQAALGAYAEPAGPTPGKTALKAKSVVKTLKAASPVAPVPPSGLEAVAGSQSVTLSWTRGNGVATYIVYRGTSAGKESKTPIKLGVTSTSYLDSGLEDGQQYYYTLVAENAAGTSSPSNEVSVTLAPPVPTGLIASSGPASISLSWDGSYGATSYTVYRGVAFTKEFCIPVKMGVTTTAYTDTGLVGKQQYYYVVKAANAAGMSHQSAEASAITDSPSVLAAHQVYVMMVPKQDRRNGRRWHISGVLGTSDLGRVAVTVNPKSTAGSGTLDAEFRSGFPGSGPNAPWLFLWSVVPENDNDTCRLESGNASFYRGQWSYGAAGTPRSVLDGGQHSFLTQPLAFKPVEAKDGSEGWVAQDVSPVFSIDEGPVHYEALIFQPEICVHQGTGLELGGLAVLEGQLETAGYIDYMPSATIDGSIRFPMDRWTEIDDKLSILGGGIDIDETGAFLAPGTQYKSISNDLLLACYKGDLNSVNLLLSKGADPNTTAGDGTTAVMCSAAVGNADLVKTLLFAGAHVNAASEEGTSALMFAAAGGFADIVDALIAAGADANPVSAYGHTALMCGAYSGKVEIVSSLISVGADIEARADDGDTAIMAAGLRSNIVALLRAGEMQDSLMKAASEGDILRVNALISKGVDVNSKRDHGMTPLFLAASTGNVGCVKALIAAGANVRIMDNDGETAIMHAATPECVTALVAAGTDVKAKDHNGETAIMHAATPECVAALMAAGADVKAKDRNGETAIMHAATPECVAALVTAGADVKARDMDGNTVIDHFVDSDALACIKVLVAAGADVNDGDGTTKALEHAVDHNEPDCIKALAAMGANVNERDANGDTILYHAIIMDHADCVQALIAAGTDVNQKNRYGETALVFAVHHEAVDCINALVVAGADVKKDNTALYEAINYDAPDCIKALAAAGANLNGRDANGDTILSHAIIMDYADCVQALITAGVDLNQTNANGDNPLFAAMRSGSEDIIPILKSAGCHLF